MTTKILAGNWKLNKNRNETREFFKALGTQAASSPVKKIVATSPTLLESARLAAEQSGVEIYSQNIAWDASGAWTGEISPVQLKDIGISGTLIGHSERRQFFGDTSESCKRRLECAMKHEIHTIFCVGETLSERKASLTRALLEEQLKAVCDLKAPRELLVIAYEPVWAIGTGVVAEVPQIKESHAWIAEILAKSGAPAYQILYGGSVKPSNFSEISKIPYVAGGLVGGASLDPKSFLELHAALML